jgi:hypothetical protein
VQDRSDSTLQVAARVAHGAAVVDEFDPLDLPDRCDGVVAGVRDDAAEHRAGHRGQCKPSIATRAEHDAARHFLWPELGAGLATFGEHMLACGDRRNHNS